MHDGFFFVNPVPEKADLEITVFGIKKPTKMTADSDEPDLPNEFSGVIVKLALATCLMKESRYQEANSEIMEVEHPITGLLTRLAETQGEEKAQGFIGKARHVRWM